MKRILVLSILILLLCAMPCYAAVYAEMVLDDSELTVPRGVSMSLVYSSVEDGAVAVATNSIFELEFSKNVVNIAVLMDNTECFHLLDENENPVEINLIFPDDQMQRQYKRQIFVAPTSELKPNSEYTLIIDNNLDSKNHVMIDNAYFISFTTGSEATGKQNRILAELGDDVLEFTTQSGKTQFSEKIYKPLILEEEREEPDYSAFKLGFMVAALLLIAASILLKTKKRLVD